MELIFNIACIFLLLVVIALLAFRKNRANDVNLSAKLDAFQVNLKEDFRINREENSTLSKENRSEQSTGLREFRTEMAETLRTNRETLSTSLKDFSLHQAEKSDELKNELKTLTEKTVELLEKITEKVEEKLRAINNQNKEDSALSREMLGNTIKNFQEGFEKNIAAFNELQREKFGLMEENQRNLVERTEKKLGEMRATVDEKLQKTLNERLGQSFELVGKQLESVQRGLGEMQTLAQDVGGLKRVLANVKMRGGFGEVQLSLLLEQILAPEQYEANVKTKNSSADLVEFAIKLPGREETSSIVWLPIDAKFPREVYEQLQTAYDSVDPIQIEIAQKLFDSAIRKMAKSISEKYVDPPNTTDFAIMFLPFESIYSEVVRKASLLDDLQRQYKIVVTGPTTLAAILNSLQMGFRTLVIQKRSGEVWKILGAVKKEFENFGGLLEKAQKNLQTASNQIDEVMGKRTRAIQRKLKGVEGLGEAESKLILPEITDLENFEDDDDQ